MARSNDESPARRDLTVPLPAMISGDDLRDARDIIGQHLPQAVAREVCKNCGAPWPCTDVRYAWMVTGSQPG